MFKLQEKNTEGGFISPKRSEGGQAPTPISHNNQHAIMKRKRSNNRKKQRSIMSEIGVSSSALAGERGQAVLIIVVFFLFITLAITFGLVTPVVQDARLARATESSAASFFAAESGLEDALYRMRERMNIDSTEALVLNNAVATTTIASVGSNERLLTAEGNDDNYIRRMQTRLSVESGVSFNFGVQAGEGGFDIKNTASIVGSAYSNGPVTGANKNIIQGDVVSAGSSGLIDGIHATSTAYAHTIQKSEIEGDAYYQTISNTTVGGTEYPDSEDKPKVDLPISDSLIEDWKSDAESGGTINCSGSYDIDADITIGPTKITCDLHISGDPTITLEGNIWVEGDITISNTATMNVAQTLEGESVSIVADYPADRESKGTIELQNSTVYNGAGDGSYIMFVSQNNSAEQGGGTDAIRVQNSAEGDLLVYAGHGRITIQNSVDLREVTAYVIELQNSATVEYETGLASLLFTSGPGGTWTIETWREVK